MEKYYKIAGLELDGKVLIQSDKILPEFPWVLGQPGVGRGNHLPPSSHLYPTLLYSRNME